MVDDLLTRLSGIGIFVQGYAVDIFFLAVDKFSNMVLEHMQLTLSTVEIWCNEVGQSVNSDKMVSFHLPEKGISRVSLNHKSFGLN